MTGNYISDKGPNYGLIRVIIFGVVGFAVLVVLSIFSHRTYKRCKSGGSRRRQRSSSRGTRRRRRSSSRGRSPHYDDYDDEGESYVSPDYTNTFDQTNSVASNQSYQTRMVDQISKSLATFIDQQPKRVKREVFAPAGKLGIIVDSSSDGPKIHSINSESPLVGKVFAGDYIVAVDGEDTSDWSAHNVTKLVARKSGSIRKLTLLSSNWDDLA